MTELRVNQNNARATGTLSFQSMKALNPSVDVFMAKLDGRKAVEAWNMPVEVTAIIRKLNAILGLRDRETTKNKRDSQDAVNAAKTRRRKIN